MIRGHKIFTMNLLMIAALITASPSAWATKKSLNVSNLPEELQQDLLARFPEISQEKLSLAEVDQVVRYLQLKDQIKSLRVMDDGNNRPLRLEYDLNLRISKVRFSGNKFLSDSEAENIFNNKSGDVFDQQNLVEGGEKLRQTYRDLGFYNAVINIEMPLESPELVAVKVQVEENKRSRIHNIILQSPNDELNKKLMKDIDAALGKPYTESTLSQIQSNAREYLSKNRYVRADLIGPNVELNKDESEATLIYRIERPEKYNFEFAGLRFLATREIEKSLDLDNFYSSNPSIGTEISQKIRKHYLDKGYARVEVTTEESERTNPFERTIVFKITEGPQVEISKFILSGQFSKKDRYYIDFIAEHSSRLVDKGYYNKDDVDSGIKNLILELQNNGYLQAKVLSSRTQYNKERDSVSIFINLDEGPLTSIETVEFSGNNSFSTEELTRVTRLQPGPLKLSQIEESIAHLKKFYKEQGYIEMLLLNEQSDLVTYNDSNTLAVLHFRIFEGPQVQVGSIVLDGNSFTRDSIINMELEFSQGDLLTPSKIEESIARLQRTGFFGSVEIRTLEEKTNVDKRTVLVKVTERDPGLFTLGAGATNERDFTLRGYTGVAYRNLWGTGRGISMRLEGNYNVADIKYLESRVVLGYLEPYLFKSRVRGRINLTRSSTVTDYDIKQVSDVRSTTYSLEKDFTSKILGIWDVWSLATIRDFGLDNSYPYIPLEQNIATTGLQLDLDFRDNPFNPSRGTFTRWNAEYSSPDIGSSETIEYWRSTLSLTHYLNLGSLAKQPVIWANQVRGGYMKNLLSYGGVPWDKKGFTLGGQSTVRGYEAGTQEVFPNRDDLGLSENDPTYYLTSNSTMALIKSELRFPIYESLGGAIFYDGGSVQIEGLDLADSYRDSAGFGIRYNTPVGPLSVDLAWKLDARPSEEPWRFHLSIGTF